MRHGHSVLWASTPWHSQACVGARAPWPRSSPGHTCSAAMCMATTTGVSGAGQAAGPSVSARCAVHAGLMCHCGWAVKQGFTSMQLRPLTPSVRADTCAQRRLLLSGVKSHFLMAHTPSTPHAPSAHSSSALATTMCGSSFRDPSTDLF